MTVVHSVNGVALLALARLMAGEADADRVLFQKRPVLPQPCVGVRQRHAAVALIAEIGLYMARFADRNTYTGRRFSVLGRPRLRMRENDRFMTLGARRRFLIRGLGTLAFVATEAKEVVALVLDGDYGAPVLAEPIRPVRYVRLVTIVAKTLHVAETAQTAVAPGPVLMVAADELDGMKIGPEVHFLRVARRAILRDIGAFGVDQLALIAVVQAMTLAAGRHARTLDVSRFVRPFVVAFFAGYLPLEVRRVAEINELGVLPFLQIAMARLASRHFDFLPYFYLLSLAFDDRPNTEPTRLLFQLYALALMAGVARLPGVADEAFLGVFTGLLVPRSLEIGDFVIGGSQLERRRVARRTCAWGCFPLTAVALAMTIGAQVHGRHYGLAWLVRKDHVTRHAAYAALEVRGMIKIDQVRIVVEVVQVAVAGLALVHRDLALGFDDPDPLFAFRGDTYTFVGNT